MSGARMRQVFFRILLPLLAPVLLAAWIYIFVLAVRELGASVFLIGPGTHVLGTISLTMWEEGGSYGAVSALGVLQIIPLIIIVAGLRWLETAGAAPQRSGRRQGRHGMARVAGVSSMFAIENLRKTFVAPGNVVVNAVDGISIGIGTGKLITLLGPSGCGKTTTLRCLAGLERPEAGKIVIADETVCDTDKGIFVPPSRPRHRHGVPVLRDLAAHDGVRERGVPAAGRARPQILRRRGQGEGAARARHGAHVGLRDAPGDAALRRPAAAARLRARAGARAEDPAARRAAVQSRRQAARADAGRAQAAAEAARHHHGLRHPRPVRGAGAVRRDRGVQFRQDHPARHAAGNLPAAQEPVRRRLHRLRQLPQGQGQGGARRPSTSPWSRPGTACSAAFLGRRSSAGQDVLVSARPGGLHAVRQAARRRPQCDRRQDLAPGLPRRGGRLSGGRRRRRNPRPGPSPRRNSISARPCTSGFRRKNVWHCRPEVRSRARGDEMAHARTRPGRCARCMSRCTTCSDEDSHEQRPCHRTAQHRARRHRSHPVGRPSTAPSGASSRWCPMARPSTCAPTAPSTMR